MRNNLKLSFQISQSKSVLVLPVWVLTGIRLCWQAAQILPLKNRFLDRNQNLLFRGDWVKLQNI